MLNRIWFWLLLIGILYGFGKAAIVDLDKYAADKSLTTAEVKTAQTEDAGSSTQYRSDVFRDTGQGLTNAALDGAQTSVDICLKLIAVMAL